MDDTQTLFQSLTIRVLTILITMVVAKLGYDVASNQLSITEIATNGATLIFAILAAYGRIRATKKITKTNGAK